MHRMIITADDYGMSPAVNAAIEEGISQGIITSTNVMTNMPCYLGSRRLMENSKISVGLHWNITCGKPVLPASQIPSLVTSTGEFYDYPQFRSRYRKKLILWSDIEKELIAQYNLFQNSIGHPDYWNTHQNSHVDFGIYSLFVNLALKLNISKMRSHQRFYVDNVNNQEPMGLLWRTIEPLKSRLLDIWQMNAHKKGMKSPNGLVLCLNHKDVYHLEYTFTHIKWGDSDIAEYVIHPATSNDSPYFGEIVDRRIWEYNAFSDKSTLQLINNAGIQLISYKQL